MNKKNLETGAFIVLGLAILAIWGWQALKPQIPESEEAILKTPEVKEVKVEEEAPQYKLNVSYPGFYGLSAASREAAVNSAIKAKIDQSIGAFKDASREAVDISPEIKSELKIDYEIVYLGPTIASVKFRESTYVEGDAHPLSIFWSFNYNFRDNREIVLAQLFNPESNYLRELSRISSESLKDQLKEYYLEESVEFGTSPEADNFSTFFLARDRLIIIFNAYSVAPYAAGSQRVEIPYDELIEVINREGPIKLVRE